MKKINSFFVGMFLCSFVFANLAEAAYPNVPELNSPTSETVYTNLVWPSLVADFVDPDGLTGGETMDFKVFLGRGADVDCNSIQVDSSLVQIGSDASSGSAVFIPSSTPLDGEVYTWCARGVDSGSQFSTYKRLGVIAFDTLAVSNFNSIIGSQKINSGVDTSLVEINSDGSILERLEYIIQWLFSIASPY